MLKSAEIQRPYPLGHGGRHFVFQIVIEGYRGASYSCDIAIDDVAMTSGSCGQGKILANKFIFYFEYF